MTIPDYALKYTPWKKKPIISKIEKKGEERKGKKEKGVL